MSNENARKKVPARGQTKKNRVAEAWEPMSNRRNGLGWGVFAEAKKFVKDVMETQSCEHGFILKWINHRYYASKEMISLKIVCVRVEHAVDNHL